MKLFALGSEMSSTESIIWFLGGISLFIFGITLMSDYLKKVSGNRFKEIIDKAVNTPLKAILVGTLITAITNSSTGVVVLVIGMVRAGLMTAGQSVGLIMGANIGTTFSAFIISLPIDKYAPIILFVGVVMLFLKHKKVVNIGGILTGIGMLFLGLNLMGDGIEPLTKTPAATDMFQAFSNESFFGTIGGFAFGTIFTAIIQSSSAATAIIQKLYSLNANEGITTITLRGSLPIILGANLGTTLTGLIAAVGGNDESKRTAWIHVIFNLLGVVVFMIAIEPYYLITQWIEDKFLSPYSMATIAYAHLVQNIVSTVILMFFIKQIVAITEKIVPPKEGSKRVELVFDEKLIEQSPAVALELVKLAIARLSEMVYEYFEIVLSYSFEKNSKLLEEANTYEMIIDELDSKIHNYLIKIIRNGIREKDTEELSKFLDISKDLERIGDHLTNIMEFFSIRYDENHTLSEEGASDLRALYSLVNRMLLSVKTAIESDYKKLPKDVMKLEEEVDKLEGIARINYINRLKSGQFDFLQTSNFTDILSDVERIGDHLNNIASSIIDPFQKNLEITGLKKK